MNYPVWLYRKHPTLGVFQSTLCASDSARAELDEDWSEDPASTGFVVKPALQLHPTHIVDGLQLHEVMTDLETGVPLVATIEMTNMGDIHG